MIRRSIVPLIAAAISLGIMLALFGLKIANPHDVSWIYEDAITAQFGWTQYRDDPAHLFPLISDRYSYPLTMPMAMFDNFPFIALIAKLCAPLLPAQFQYFGPFFLIGVVFQVLFAWLLIGEATRGRTGVAYQVSLLLGTLFLSVTPILIARFFMAHMSISQHWPLLASLWLYARSNRVDFKNTIRNYTILGFIVGSMNPYLTAMVMIIYLTFFIKLMIERSLSVKRFVALILPPAISMIAFTIWGFFNPLGSGLIGGDGYGFYSANLNSPINPISDYVGSSFVSQQQNWSIGQNEGYGYLGLGAILLVITSIPFARIKRESGDSLFPPLAITIFAAYLLALSSTISFGIYSFQIPLPEKILGILNIFRSSGRFIWIVEYSVLFISIVALIRLLRPHHAPWALTLFAMIQIADLAGPLADLRQRFIVKGEFARSDRFSDPAYVALGKNHDTLTVMPPWQCRFWNSSYKDYTWFGSIRLANLATDNHLRTNSFYSGRLPIKQAEYHCATYPASMGSRPTQQRTAYLLNRSTFLLRGSHVAATHYCDYADGMFICRGDRQKAGLSARAQAALAASNLIERKRP
jgi:hypothetical protein